jgi:hypothetical protein
MKTGRPKTAGTRFICVACFKSKKPCLGLQCPESRIVLNSQLIRASSADSCCHICRLPAMSDCAHCGRRSFCEQHFEGLCRHCQDVHCDCEDLWKLRLTGTEVFGDWSVQEHLQLALFLEKSRSFLGQTYWEAGIPRSKEDCEMYLREVDKRIRHEKKVYLSYPIRRIVYSKLDKREIFQWPSSRELLVRSVYPRLHYRYSLPATLDKLTPKFVKLLEKETEKALKECMYHRHRLFDLTPGVYDFNSFETKLVQDGQVHGKLAKLWYLCRYRKQYLRKTRCSVPLAHTFRQPYGKTAVAESGSEDYL